MLKEYHTMLYGFWTTSTQTIKIILSLSFKPNIFYTGGCSLRTLQFQFCYIKGESNSLADALSHLQSWCTTAKNSLENIMCKQMHQSFSTSLHVLHQWNPPAGLDNAHALVDAALAKAMYAIHASFHTSLKTISFPLRHGYNHPTCCRILDPPRT
jgi:hypothetical protein